MTHGSLFSGIGGFDLAAEWMGWENVFHCEWDPFCQKILKHYWPDAKSYTDITKTDFTVWRGKIDIITGGFPCQPFSSAGKRKGKEDNRYLWPEMLRAIKEVQPAYVVAENVYGIINQGRGMVFEQVQAEMEDEGYQVQSYLLPACALNAPHRRDRFWFVAHTESDIWVNGIRDEGQEPQEVQEKRFNESIVITNSSSIQRDKEREKEQQCGAGGQSCGNVGGIDGKGNVANSNNQGLQGSEINGSIGEIGENGNKQLAGLLQPGWQNFPTQPPVRPGNDGLSFELDGITFSKWSDESIKALGNAIVPQVVFEIFKAIEQYEKTILEGVN